MSLMISANDVTVKDCTFTDTTGVEAIYQWTQASGATVENNTFTGSLTTAGCGGCVVNSINNITIANNSFFSVQNDGIHIEQGTVSGNYMQFGGGGDDLEVTPMRFTFPTPPVRCPSLATLSTGQITQARSLSLMTPCALPPSAATPAT